MQSFHRKTIEENKQILASIISCIIFCGTHSMPLRGKEADGGVFLDLLNLRINSGDHTLKNHIEKCRRNASYTSPQIQNELISICGEVIKGDVLTEIKNEFYSVLADETADIAGKEQLSLGLRFFDERQNAIREKFLGFVELNSLNASSIAETIDQFLISSNLSPQNCVGFGFDGWKRRRSSGHFKKKIHYSHVLPLCKSPAQSGS